MSSAAQSRPEMISKASVAAARRLSRVEARRLDGAKGSATLVSAACNNPQARASREGSHRRYSASSRPARHRRRDGAPMDIEKAGVSAVDPQALQLVVFFTRDGSPY